MIRIDDYEVKSLVERTLERDPEITEVNYIEVTDRINHGETQVFIVGAFVEHEGGGTERKEFSLSIEIKEQKFL